LCLFFLFSTNFGAFDARQEWAALLKRSQRRQGPAKCIDTDSQA